jgi:hypothetical protein
MSEQQPQQLQLKADDQTLRGIYANGLQISHTKNEVVFDFLSVLPPQGQLLARIITSPLHAKHILKALEQNIDQYEKNFGRLEAGDEPQREFGFTPGSSS